MPRHNCVRNRLCACTKNSFPIPWHPPEALSSFSRCLDTHWKGIKTAFISPPVEVRVFCWMKINFWTVYTANTSQICYKFGIILLQSPSLKLLMKKYYHEIESYSGNFSLLILLQRFAECWHLEYSYYASHIYYITQNKKAAVNCSFLFHLFSAT